jgi:glutathione S-transferase
MQLYIGNKNYSSWSLRPWLLMRQTGIAFSEHRLRLDSDTSSAFKQTLLALAPSGRVPLLVDDDGFAALRNRCPMNIEASLPEIGARAASEWPDLAADLQRIDAMWSEQLAASGGPFLFGAFGIVDAYYAPVCARAKTYALPLGAAAAGYVARIHALPAMQEWCRAALDEHDFLPEDEPYRQRA